MSAVEPLPPPTHFNPPVQLLSLSPILTSTRYHTVLCIHFFSISRALSAIMDFLKFAFFAWMGWFLLQSSPTTTADAPR